MSYATSVRLFRSPRQPPRMRRAAPAPLPAAADLAHAEAVMRHSCTVSSAYLALLGDKRLLFSANGRAFIMYGVTRRSWVAMGDPVGPAEELPDLVRRFIALCARHRVRPAFYRVDPAHLPLFRSHGLLAVKLGEEAIVPLGADRVALRGRGFANLRYSKARAEREGCRFEVIEPAHSAEVLTQLTAVSAAWLKTKSTREKRFSGGRFDPDYLAHFPLAVIWWRGAPIAFGNLWLAPDRSELMVDLMRRSPDAPYGTMDLLFASLMSWGTARGYAQLNLGMAPLCGYGEADLPPFWRAVARTVVRHGSRFYNFDGLRRFKTKFAPHWRPRYLACRPGLDLPVTVFDTALLVAGGLRGLIAK